MSGCCRHQRASAPRESAAGTRAARRRTGGAGGCAVGCAQREGARRLCAGREAGRKGGRRRGLGAGRVLETVLVRPPPAVSCSWTKGACQLERKAAIEGAEGVLRAGKAAKRAPLALLVFVAVGHQLVAAQRAGVCLLEPPGSPRGFNNHKLRCFCLDEKLSPRKLAGGHGQIFVGLDSSA
eukprot:3936530-Rhodomonas_salina.4